MYALIKHNDLIFRFRLDTPKSFYNQTLILN